MSSAYLAQPDTLEQLKRAVAESDFAAMNTIDISLAELMQAEEREAGFESMSAQRQRYLSTYNAEGYVNGEGIEGLFQYMSDQEMDAMLAGYEQFEAIDLLKIIQKAIKKFPKSPPVPSHADREEILDQWLNKGKEPFEKLDAKFMDIGSAMTQRLKNALEHADQFFAL